MLQSDGEKLRARWFFICENFRDSWNKCFQEKKFPHSSLVNGKQTEKGPSFKYYIPYSFLPLYFCPSVYQF